MISVGTDVSKGKSIVCILKLYGEIMYRPFGVQHVEKDLESFGDLLDKPEGEIRIVMEATGIYHLPVLTFLHDKGYFVSVINPFAMIKKYAVFGGALCLVLLCPIYLVLHLITSDS